MCCFFHLRAQHLMIHAFQLLTPSLGWIGPLNEARTACGLTVLLLDYPFIWIDCWIDVIAQHRNHCIGLKYLQFLNVVLQGIGFGKTHRLWMLGCWCRQKDHWMFEYPLFTRLLRALKQRFEDDKARYMWSIHEMRPRSSK